MKKVVFGIGALFGAGLLFGCSSSNQANVKKANEETIELTNDKLTEWLSKYTIYGVSATTILTAGYYAIMIGIRMTSEKKNGRKLIEFNKTSTDNTAKFTADTEELRTALGNATAQITELTTFVQTTIEESKKLSDIVASLIKDNEQLKNKLDLVIKSNLELSNTAENIKSGAAENIAQMVKENEVA